MGQSASSMNNICYFLKCHVLWVEYPGYGICFKEAKNSELILKRAKRAYDFLTQEFGYDEKDIIIWGRSIGFILKLKYKNKLIFYFFTLLIFQIIILESSSKLLK